MSFSSLPNEIIFRTLRDIPVEDLPSFCQSNSLYRNACADSYFWEQKFAHEGLPILGKGYDFSSWLAVYRSSLFSKTYTDRFVQEFTSGGGKETYINFLPEQVKDPQILFLGDARPAEIVKFLTQAWNVAFQDKLRETKNFIDNKPDDSSSLQSDIKQTEIIQQFFDEKKFAGDSVAVYSLGLIYHTDFPQTYNLSLEINDSNSGPIFEYNVQLNLDDLWNLIYRLTYFRIPTIFETP